MECSSRPEQLEGNENYHSSYPNRTPPRQLPDTNPDQIRNSSPDTYRITLMSATVTATISATTTKPINPSLAQTQKHLDPTIAWTSSISRYSKSGNLSKANDQFLRMRLSGAEPNHVTFVSLLSGCAHFPSPETRPFGSSLHGYVRKLGLDRENVKVGTALVDMYSKSGLVELSRRVFDEIWDKNSMTWNTMVDGYVRNGRIEDAVVLFDEMPQRTAISWTAMIGGFVKQGLYEQALELFCEMQLSGVEPDHVTILGVISAIANLGMLNLGLWINRFIMGKGDFMDHIRLSNSLIDMYCRCGNVEFAQEIFNSMRDRSVVSWNSIISGLASNGRAEDALRYFRMMQMDGFEPDGVSFTGALSACSHAGLLKEGLRLFKTMRKLHGVEPRIEHYGCLIDLYSRAGRLEDAMKAVGRMPMKPNEVVLGSLLSACRDGGDVELGEGLMDYLVELDHLDVDSNYVMLANMYAAIGSWEGSGKVRRKMKDRGIKKLPGVSLIEIDGSVHEFVAGDKWHEEAESIYGVLKLMLNELKDYGYVPIY